MEDVLLAGLELRVQGHLRIFEYQDRAALENKTPSRTLLNRRNAIHKDNVSIMAIKAITNRPSSQIAYMCFGNGGTTLNDAGSVLFNAPHVGASAELYNQIYFNLVDDNQGTLLGNSMSVRHIANTFFSDIDIRCVIGTNLPFGQRLSNTIDGITEPTTLLNLNNEQFAFDEIGLKMADGTLITHVVFVPVVKNASSFLEVVYTIRIATAMPFPSVINGIVIESSSATTTQTDDLQSVLCAKGVILDSSTQLWNIPEMTDAGQGIFSIWINPVVPTGFGELQDEFGAFAPLLSTFGASFSTSEIAKLRVTVSHITIGINAVITLTGVDLDVVAVGSTVMLVNVFQSGWGPTRREVNVLSHTSNTITTNWNTTGFPSYNPGATPPTAYLNYITNISNSVNAVITTSTSHGIDASWEVDVYISIQFLNQSGWSGGDFPALRVVSSTDTTLTVEFDTSSFPSYVASDNFEPAIVIMNSIAFGAVSDNGPNPYEFFVYTTRPVPLNQWTNVLISWNTSLSAGQKLFSMYFNDTEVPIWYKQDNDPAFLIQYSDPTHPEITANNSSKISGAYSVYPSSGSASIAEVWFKTGVYMDFSDPNNRAFFHDDQLRAIDLGDGSQILGTAPVMYLSLRDGEGILPDTPLVWIEPNWSWNSQSPNALAGVPDSSTMVLSFWIDRNTTGEIIYHNGALIIDLNTENQLGLCDVEMFDSSNNTFGFTFEYERDTTKGINIRMAVDLNHPIGEKVVQVYAGIVEATVTVIEDDADNMLIKWNDPSTVINIPGGSDLFGYFSEFWWAPGQFFDVSNKFVDLNGDPVDLGPTGMLPSETQPAVFFHLDQGDPITGFTVNRGSGGEFLYEAHPGYLDASGTRFTDNKAGTGLLRVSSDGRPLLLAPGCLDMVSSTGGTAETSHDDSVSEPANAIDLPDSTDWPAYISRLIWRNNADGSDVRFGPGMDANRDLIGGGWVQRAGSISGVDGSQLFTATQGDLADAVDTFYGFAVVNRSNFFPTTKAMIAPVAGGQYLIAHFSAASVHAPNLRLEKWYVILGLDSTQGDLDVRGAYWAEVGATGAPYTVMFGMQSIGQQTADDPIIVMATHSIEGIKTGISILPSPNEFIAGTYKAGGWGSNVPYTHTYAAGEIPNIYWPYISSDNFNTDLFQSAALYNRGFFTLPNSGGGTNLYIYLNRKYIESNNVVGIPDLHNVEIRSVIGPVYPHGAFVKVVLTTSSLSFTQAAASATEDTAGLGSDIGAGQGALMSAYTNPYSIDNANWITETSPSIPFSDEYSSIFTGDTEVGTDYYNPVPTQITNNGDGTWSVYFHMWENTAISGTPAIIHKGIVRIRNFLYNTNTEVATQVDKITGRAYRINESAGVVDTATFLYFDDDEPVISGYHSISNLSLVEHGTVFRSKLGHGSYVRRKTPHGVSLNGTQAITINSPADLSNTTGTGVLSFWYKTTDISNTFLILEGNTNVPIQVKMVDGYKPQFIFKDSTGTKSLTYTLTPSLSIPFNSWVHYIFAWDTNFLPDPTNFTNTTQFLYSIRSQGGTLTYNKSTSFVGSAKWKLNYGDTTSWSFFGNSSQGTASLIGEVAEFWFRPGYFLDISKTDFTVGSDVNLNFSGPGPDAAVGLVNETYYPAEMGSDGSLPLVGLPVSGVKPFVYFTSTSSPGAFATNQGSGGNTTLTGSLGASADNP